MSAEAARADKIRALFKKLGGRKLSMLEFAKAVRKAKLFSDEEIAALAIKKIADECRRVLSVVDPETGVPYAQPDADDTWTQVILFSSEEFEGLIRRRTKGVRDDVAAVMRLIDYFKARWGYDPNVDLDFGGTP